MLTWSSPRYTYVPPPWTSLPRPPHPTALCCRRAPVWLPEPHRTFSPCFHAILSILATLPFPHCVHKCALRVWGKPFNSFRSELLRFLGKTQAVFSLGLINLHYWGKTSAMNYEVFQLSWWETLFLAMCDCQALFSPQCSSAAQSCPTPWTAARQASLSITDSRSPPKPMSIESVMPSSHLILCQPLLFPPSIFLRIRVFSNESALHIRWPKWVSASASVLPMDTEDWSPLGWTGWISLQCKIIKSLLQHHSSKASILQHSAFFIVQLTSIHDYWKNHSLD